MSAVFASRAASQAVASHRDEVATATRPSSDTPSGAKPRSGDSARTEENAVGFTRRMVRLKSHAAMVDALVLGGLAVVAGTVTDEQASALAVEAWDRARREAWDAGDRPRHAALCDAAPGPVARAGFRIAQEASGALLTPAGWLFGTVDAACGCTRFLAGHPGYARLFAGRAADIVHLGAVVIAAHREHGCFTGRFDHLSRLDAAIDANAMQARLAELKAGQACDRWREMTGRS